MVNAQERDTRTITKILIINKRENSLKQLIGNARAPDDKVKWKIKKWSKKKIIILDCQQKSIECQQTMKLVSGYSSSGLIRNKYAQHFNVAAVQRL